MFFKQAKDQVAAREEIHPFTVKYDTANRAPAPTVQNLLLTKCSTQGPMMVTRLHIMQVMVFLETILQYTI